MSATRKDSGIGVVEVLIAATLGLFMFLTLSYFSSGSRTQSKKMTNSGICEAFAQNIRSVLDASNEKVKVRNWAPAHPGDRRAPGDTLDQFSFDKHGNLLGDKFFNSQNLLNTTNWALAMYNNHNPAICKDDGGRPFVDQGIDQFLSQLPEPVTRPQFLEKIDLFVKQRDLAAISPNSQTCSDHDVEAHPKLRMAFSIRMQFHFREGEKDTFCEMTYYPQFSQDDERPTLWAAFRNSDDVSFSPGDNACMRSCISDDMKRAEMLPVNTCKERSLVTMAVHTKEPGSLFFCKRVGKAWGDLEDENFRVCNEIATNTTLMSKDINATTHVEFQFPPLGDRPDHPYQVDILTVDTAGNTTEARYEFWVYIPQCRNECPDSYIPWRIGNNKACLTADANINCNETLCIPGS